MTLQTLYFSKITKFKGYKYFLNHQDKWFTIFILYCICRTSENPRGIGWRFFLLLCVLLDLIGSLESPPSI
jgi:hypothetical protein